jgi:LuxR family maltose regulon positive regulatory protein
MASGNQHIKSIHRSRLSRLIHDAAIAGTVFIAASAGSGKTCAMRDYLNSPEYQHPCTLAADKPAILWLNISPHDNDGGQFWHDFVQAIPETHESLAKTLSGMDFIRNEEECISLLAASGIIIVVDDFHKLQNEQVLSFICNVDNTGSFATHTHPIQRVPLFILSRISPLCAAGMTARLMLQSSRYSIIQGDALRFQYSELGELLEANGLALAPLNQQNIIDETDGWSWAVSCYVLALLRNPNNTNCSKANVRQTIHKYFENTIFANLSDSHQSDLICTAILAHFSPSIEEEIIMDSPSARNSHEIWEVIGFLDYYDANKTFHFRPLVHSYLVTLSGQPSLEDRQQAYRCGARWCIKYGESERAVYYFSQLNDYRQMMNILLEYPLMPSQAVSSYCLELLDNTQTPDSPADDPEGCLVLLKESFAPRYLVNLGRFEEAQERIVKYLAKWEAIDSDQQASGKPVDILTKIMLFSLYSVMSYCRLHSCTLTHQYDFATWANKSKAIIAKYPFEIFGVGNNGYTTMRSFACFVGEGATPDELEKFTDEVRLLTANNTNIAVQGLYYGYDMLCECEINYYRGDFAKAKLAANQVITIAANNNQYEVEATAIFYLIKIAIHDCDFQTSDDLLAHLAARSKEPEFLQGSAVYGFSLAMAYAVLGIMPLIPPWLRSSTLIENSQITMCARDNLVRARCLLVSNKYAEALAVLQLPSFSKGDGLFLFTKLMNACFTAAAQLGLGNNSAALAAFEQAWKISQNGELITPFVESGHTTHSLVKLAQESGQTIIPAKWLIDIDRQASAFTKKAAIVAGDVRLKHGISKSIALTEREKQILHDICRGLTREEIAATRYLSINTVKTELKTLYSKLNATSNIDAMRIAMEHDLLTDFNKLF